MRVAGMEQYKGELPYRWLRKNKMIDIVAKEQVNCRIGGLEKRN